MYRLKGGLFKETFYNLDIQQPTHQPAEGTGSIFPVDPGLFTLCEVCEQKGNFLQGEGASS